MFSEIALMNSCSENIQVGPGQSEYGQAEFPLNSKSLANLSGTYLCNANLPAFCLFGSSERKSLVFEFRINWDPPVAVLRPHYMHCKMCRPHHVSCDFSCGWVFYKEHLVKLQYFVFRCWYGWAFSDCFVEVIEVTEKIMCFGQENF